MPEQQVLSVACVHVFKVSTERSRDDVNRLQKKYTLPLEMEKWNKDSSLPLVFTKDNT